MAYKQQKCLPHSSGGEKSKIRAPANRVSGENLLPGSQSAVSLLCPHWWKGCKRSPESLLKGTNPIHVGSTLMTTSKTHPNPLGLGFNMYIWGRHTHSAHSNKHRRERRAKVMAEVESLERYAGGKCHIS